MEEKGAPCKHRPKSLWREKTVCLKCGQKIEANGPFWMNMSVQAWILYAAVQTLRGYGLLPWVDALPGFWNFIAIVSLPFIPTIAIQLIYRKYFSPYEGVEDLANRKHYL